MARTAAPRFRKTMLALAAGAVVAPCSAWALNLAEAPPGTVEPYVRPNVIISVDDSGSMDWQVTNSNTGDAAITTPNADGSWPNNAKRINILKYALTSIFDPTHPQYDPALLPDKKIRLAWQTMWNNGNSPDAKNVDSATMQQNSMRILENSHRTNFLSFVKSIKASNGTPSHLMFRQADAYMRRPLGVNSAWASDPGTTDTPYLACRRSYHIMMTDGRWNGTALPVPDTNKRDNATNLPLPDGMVYGGASAADIAKTALYRDNDGWTSLADWAFYSWAVPMQTGGMTGTMQTPADYNKAPATENFGKDSANKDAILERYWNPRYNPARWPHMVTYTIGFSNDATTWPGASNIFAPAASDRLPFKFTGSFQDLVTGTKTWPPMDAESKRSLDLWHAAINGRGRFYAVTKGEDLEQAFRDIFGQINTATDPNLSASATSGSNVSRSEVGKYTAGYEPDKFWKGTITADKVKKDGTTYQDPNWNGKSTADLLDAATVGSRLVLSWSDKWTGTAFQGGVPFQWAADESKLSTSQKLWLQKNSSNVDEGATKGQQRLDYIRGDRSLEGVDPGGYSGSKPFRQRMSIQGDIINSDVWYTGAPAANHMLKGYTAFVKYHKSRPGMLYVGGNDGMLHGFAAYDGQEKLAYVPRGVIPTLTLLTDPQYNNKHKYFVDGSPMTGDVDLNGGMQDPNDPNYGIYTANWRTLLVGTLGLGGKGYFVLDVTNPSANNLGNGTPGMSETNAAQLVKLDRTRGAGESAPNCAVLTGAEQAACLQIVDEDKDIGHITARPVRDDNDSMRTTQITRMNNNRWAVVLGNGYNSANQRPVLLVQYLDGAKELLRLPVTTDSAGTGKAADNGLASPRVVDLNGDGLTDLVYAGDNQGNLWKFDLTSHNPANWAVAFGGNPLFTALGPAALNGPRTKVQPIVAAPTARANDRKMEVGSPKQILNVGGMMVSFGTGRNITTDDPTNADVQTLYSVLDNTRYRQITTPLGKRLEVHPGAGTCPGTSCIPAPTALGAGAATAKLAKREFIDIDMGDYGAIKEVDALSEKTWANWNGWYLDLPAVGERLLKPFEFYDSSNLLTVWSQVPAKGSNANPNVESCDVASVDGERQYRTFVNIMDGKAPSIAVVDKDKNGKFNMGTLLSPGGDAIANGADLISISRAKVAKGPHSIIKKDKFENVDIDAKNNKEHLAAMPEESLRPSWRQIQ
ncbi:MAG: PilC/PilY family type IV pilus protein [Alicycliphilus sp.]